MLNRNSSSKAERILKGAALTIAMLGMSALGGCSSSSPPPPAQQAAVAKTELHFDLNKCQQMEAGLYKCPASDKAIATPTTMAKPNASASDRTGAFTCRAASPIRRVSQAVPAT
jgi:hypothetical protein